MDKASLKIYRRVCLTNCYDRMCNFILLHVFPLLKSSDAEVDRCYSALKYADSDLKAEKEKLKNLKKSLCNNNIAILGFGREGKSTYHFIRSFDKNRKLTILDE